MTRKELIKQFIILSSLKQYEGAYTINNVIELTRPELEKLLNNAIDEYLELEKSTSTDKQSEINPFPYIKSPN